MNIAFDAVAVLGITQNRGIGYYTEQLMRNMIIQDEKNSYFLFNVIEPFHLFDVAPKNYKEDYFDIGDKFDHKKYESNLKKFLSDNKIDVFCITGAFYMGDLFPIPNRGSMPIYQKDWFGKTKVVSICYDLILRIFKEKYLGSDAEQKYKRCEDQFKWSDMCITISECTSFDLSRYLGVNKNKIACIWGGYKKDIKKVSITEEDWTQVKIKYGICHGFIMAPLADDFRKNATELLRGYARLSSDIRREHQLVIVCALSDKTEDKLEEIARKEGCAGSVIFTNFVSDELMLKLYNMADLVAFPSLYEGFGMPIVEAFACETPVLTSNNSSCAQVAGDAAYLVNPFFTEDIYRGLEEALSDAKKEEMIKRGKERLAKFQWEKVAAEAIAAFERLGKEEFQRETTAPLANIKITEGKSQVNNWYMDVTMIAEHDYGFGIHRTVNNLYENMRSLGSQITPIRYKKDEDRYITANKYIAHIDRVSFDGLENMVKIKKGDVCFFPDSAWDMGNKLILETAKRGVSNYCVLYDLIPILYPGSHGGNVRELYIKWIDTALRLADGFICISKTVANDMIRYYHLNKDKYHREKPLQLYVIHLGFDVTKNFVPARRIVREFIQKKGKTTFLMVGTVEPRKNHCVVMKALKEVYKDYPNANIQLLVMGRNGWLSEEFQSMYFSDKFYWGKALWIQDAEDHELRWAYEHASALIQASKTEGFGLPIVEAAYHGLPILCSDIPIFRELAGNNVDYFKVNDVESVKNAMLNWCDSSNHPDVKKIKLNSWKDCAKEVVNILDGTTKPYATVL